MRNSFVSALTEAAVQDASIMLITGDLGYGVVDDFALKLPKQFLNVGVAEQNMIGVASGLAQSGFRPFVYSIANFSTLRCLEQIRNDVCYHDLGVTIVSVGAGLAYGALGYSHFAVEDIAVMRALPGLRILSPADPLEANACVASVLDSPGPTYVRLGKGGEGILHDSPPVTFPRPATLRAGRDLSLVSTGSAVGLCLAASDLLAERGYEAAVTSVPQVAPLDAAWIDDLKADLPVVVVEEHRLPGGLGASIVEALSNRGKLIPVRRIGLPDTKLSDVGSAQYLRDVYGLSPIAIASACEEFLTSAERHSRSTDASLRAVDALRARFTE